jgi:hypothetical protein
MFINQNEDKIKQKILIKNFMMIFGELGEIMVSF